MTEGMKNSGISLHRPALQQFSSFRRAYTGMRPPGEKNVVEEMKKFSSEEDFLSYLSGSTGLGYGAYLWGQSGGMAPPAIARHQEEKLLPYSLLRYITPVDVFPVDVVYTACGAQSGEIRNISFVGSSGMSVIYMSEEALYLLLRPG